MFPWTKFEEAPCKTTPNCDELPEMTFPGAVPGVDARPPMIVFWGPLTTQMPRNELRIEAVPAALVPI